MNDSFAKNIQSSSKTPPLHINRPESNQQNDQPESVASVSQYFAPMQAEFDEKCDNFEQHLRQTCVEFESIQKEIIESSDVLADQLLTNRKLQQQLSQAKGGKTAQLSLYGLEMTATESATDTMKSKLDALKKQIRGHYDEQTELHYRGAKKQAKEYHEQRIVPLELQRDQLAKDIERLESKNRQIDSIDEEIGRNSENIRELEDTLQKLMRELRLKAGAAYLDNINDVSALKAEIANHNQDVIKMRDERRDQLAQKDADIAAIREDMKVEMKRQADQFAAQMQEQANHFTARMEDKDAEILAIHDEMKQYLKITGAQALAASQPSTNLTFLPFDRDNFVYIAIFILSLFSLISFGLSYNDIGDAGAQALTASTTLTDLALPIANHDQDILNIQGQIKEKADQFAAQVKEQANQLIQNDAGIAAVREDMEGQMKKQAEQFTVQTKELGDEMNAKIIGIRDEMKQQSDQFRAQLQAQLLSSVTPNSIEELLHLITAPQGSLMLVSLTSLDLSKCKLGDKKADFFKALFKMPNLAYLSLCGNDIGDDGVQALAISITSTKLTSLDLRSNNIGEAGAEALAASKTLTNLTSLNLVDNYIADAGAEALATSTTLTNLTSLDLRHNYIEPPGAQAMRTRYPFISV